MKKLILIFILLYSFISPVNADDDTYIPPANNVNIWGDKGKWNSDENKRLDDLQTPDDIKVPIEAEKSAVELLYTVARDLKTVMYIVAWVYFLILTVRLLFTSNTEEWAENFKKWIIWISIWIVVMQIAYYFVNTLYANEVWWALASNFIENIIEPIIKLLETATSFIFVLMAIYAFYKVVTANWDEQKVSDGKKTIFFAIIWFIVVKLAKDLVYAVYWAIDCKDRSILSFQLSWNCTTDSNLTWIAAIIVRIINWMNGFVWILVIGIILYAWAQLLLSHWDEEALTKVKKSIIYIVIWIAILVFNYFILTFFLIPETPI